MRLVRDPELLARFRAGDRDAMAIVFEHYAGPLARYLAAGFAFETAGAPARFDGVRSRFDLHDLVAETFRRAFEERARGAFAASGPFEGYLRAIARNLVLDRLRGGRPEAGAGALDAAAEPRPTPEEACRLAELRRLVEAFRGALEPLERRLLALRYQDGLSQEDAAVRLKTTRRWVRDREAALRARLERHLRGSGYGPGRRP
ncbi:MAG TPA: sigma-70 family RNA polymerase sigma factor [Polyangia bacterium]|jgi:RNA polymerase sigma factor (sigma-70 family)